MSKQDFGMVGMGVMGQMFSLNVERNGFGVSVYDIKEESTRSFIEKRAAGKNITPTYSIQEFVDSLARPRRIMLLVPAGKAVAAVVEDLTPVLQESDLIIDGGNSYFLDTERRTKALESKGLSYLGMGVSGGEEGARCGPSLMPGGSKSAYEKVEHIMTAVAAKAEEDGEPCVTYLGPGGAGHFVKMVHNGIEYGDMQLISESYDLLKRTLDLSAQDFHDIFSAWNDGELASFLIEITAEIFKNNDEDTGKLLLDVILDEAGQKGTGKWTSQQAMDLGVAIPTITAAVDARFVSAIKDERVRAARVLQGPSTQYRGQAQKLIDAVRDALFASKVCSYAQGMHLLQMASAEYEYDLKLADVARIWRNGCIIRARLLNDIMHAFDRKPDLTNLLLDEKFHEGIHSRQSAWRSVLNTATEIGVPMPAMNASLAYFDAYRSERLPANMIQAQRDFFGAHTFKRVDKKGTFHADWY